MNRLYLVRHAHAGERGAWNGPDTERPLSEKGLSQAAGLVSLLGQASFSEVWSSPALRCLQTVQPLADARGLQVSRDARLLEGNDPRDTMLWLEARTDRVSLVASTHGDLIPGLLELVSASGCKMPAGARWAKGSTWVLERDNDRWRSATYLPPTS